MSAYLDGELAGRRRRRMERHLAECGECHWVFGGLKLVTDALRRLSPPQGGGALRLADSVRLQLSEPPDS